MKRTRLAALVIVLALVVASCGGKDGKDTKTSTSAGASSSSSSVAATGGGSTTPTTAPPVPQSVEGLQVWLRGDAGVASSEGKVMRWDDQTSNGLNAAQGEPGRQPTLDPHALNGHQGLRFDGVDDGLTIPFNLSPGANPNITVFTVFSTEEVPRGTLRKLYGHDDGGYDRATGWDDRALPVKFVFFAGSGAKAYFDPTPRSATITSDIWTPTTFSGYVNGQQRQLNVAQSASAGQATMALGGIRPNSALAPGASQVHPGGFEPWQGVIAEFLIYNRALGAEERQRVETYLMNKYGIG